MAMATPLPEAYYTDIKASHDRCKAVLDSCKTITQVDGAARYIRLMDRRIHNELETAKQGLDGAISAAFIYKFWCTLANLLVKDVADLRNRITDQHLWKAQGNDIHHLWESDKS